MKPNALARHRAVSSPAFTLVELLTVIAIIAILAAIIIPVVGKIRLSARTSHSLTNLKTIGQATLLHASEHRGRLPTKSRPNWAAVFWTKQIEPFLIVATRQSELNITGTHSTVSSLFYDPLVEDGKHGTVSDYGVNRLVLIDGEPNHGLPLQQIARPASTVLAATAFTQSNGGGSWYIEAAAYVNNPLTNYRPDDRGYGNVLAVFADGHAASILKDEFVERRREFFLIN